MPVGNAYATGNIITYIETFHIKNKKLKVLDVGCGMGHNGFIFREMFEVRYSRLKPKDWIHRMEAIEVFKNYRNPAWDYLYDNVIINDCMKALPVLKDNSYDIIFATEILEHFEVEQMHRLLDLLLMKLSKDGSIIVTIPTGEKEAVLSQKDCFGNVFETHRSYVTIKDFEKYNIKHKINDGVFMIGGRQ